MGDLTNMPKAILIALDKVRSSFGCTEVIIDSDCYRLEPTEYSPAGALGCDIKLKICDWEMEYIKIFFSNALAEDICWSPYGQLISDEFVFDIIRPEYEKLKLLN